MRKFAQMGLAVAAAALAAPAFSLAGEPEFPASYYVGQNASAPAGAVAGSFVAPTSAPVAHNHPTQDSQLNTRFRILPTKKKTAEQQRQELLAKGVYVPPVPATPPTGAILSEGPVVGCASCEANATGMVVMGSPIEGRVLASSGEAPGRAVVGGMSAMASTAGEPTPIGVMRTNYSPNSPSPMSEAPGRAVVGGGRGSVPTPGSVGHEFAPSGFGRPNSPKVLHHLFGIPTLHEIRVAREHRGDKERERHAMQALGAEGGPVGSLPPSMVYGAR